MKTNVSSPFDFMPTQMVTSKLYAQNLTMLKLSNISGHKNNRVNLTLKIIITATKGIGSIMAYVTIGHVTDF